MNRKTASKVVEQMYTTCAIDPKKTSVMLLDKRSNDFELHANAKLNFGSRICIAAIADQHKLRFREQPEKIVLTEAQ